MKISIVEFLELLTLHFYFENISIRITAYHEGQGNLPKAVLGIMIAFSIVPVTNGNVLKFHYMVSKIV